MGNLTTTKSGELVSFASPKVAAIKSLKVHFSPKQTGGGDPSPENVREISGWNKIAYHQCKHVRKIIPANFTTMVNNGITLEYLGDGIFSIHGDCTDVRAIFDFDIEPFYFTILDQYFSFNTDYRGSISQYDISFSFRDVNFKNIMGIFPITARYDTIFSYLHLDDEIIKEVLNMECRKFRMVFKKDMTNMIFSIILSDSLNTGKIDFEEDIGAIYGGWADLVTGEVVRDWLINTHTVAATDGTPGGTGTGNNTNYRFIAWNLASAHLPDSERTKQAVCNIAPNSRQVGGTRFWLGGGTVYMVLPNDNKEYSVIIAYAERDLNTDTYQLEPTELQTLIGTNNIWSNADYVEVEYEIAEPKNILDIKKRIIAAAPHIITPSPASIQTFTTDMASPLKECKVHFSPVQEGTGDPSPDNVRPITGWTGVEVYRTGKNLFDPTKLPPTVNNYYTEHNGYLDIVHNYGLGWVNQPTCLFIQPGTYTASTKLISGTATVSSELRSSESNWVWESWGTPSRPTKTYADSRHMAIRITGEGNTVGLQVELGSTATAYEPYSGTAIPINWSDSGTIYGGYVDLVNGEVVAEHGLFTVDEPNTVWEVASKTNIRITFARKYIFSSRLSRNASACTILPENASTNWTYGYVDNTRATDTNHSLCLCYTGDGDGWAELIGETATVENAKSYLRNVGFAICATLIEPIHYSIDPTTLKTLRGTNNIWSNANGNIELSYWKH